MKWLLMIVALLLSFSSPAFAVDVSLGWDTSVNATGYKVEKSIDGGSTWGTPVDVGNVQTYLWKAVEENVMVLFRVSAYNASGPGAIPWYGAWFDFRKKPLMPGSGAAVK